MKLQQLAIITIALLMSYSTPSLGVENQEDDSGISEVESIFDKDGEKEEVVAPPNVEESAPAEISSLKNLQPFSDIAVIQRKYLPMTKRFEIYGGGNAIVNNAFFLNFGLVGRLAYHFTEAFGAEFVFMALTNSERDVTKDLSTLKGITTNGLVAPEMYYGGAAVWTPVYGKMALFENRIVPFDLYFAAGGGITRTNQKESAPTFQLSTGQRFALSKKMAFRWDFTWNFYSANYTLANSTTKANGNFDNLFLALGFSFFFPEATYR